MELFGYNLEEIIYWHWWVLAGVFFVLEVLSMSFFFLWLGASAVVVGIVVMVMPDMSWQMQCTLWGLISILDLIGWRVYKKNSQISSSTSDEPNLNKRGDQYIGRVFTLESPIENGLGKVKVDDSIWKV